MWTCSGCAIVREKPESRPPQGWKRLGEAIFCAACWRKQYLLRAITVPVVEPVGATWENFRGALREMFAQSTQASNWMMTEFYARDIRRQGEDTKMPALSRVYLYPEVRQRFPLLPSQTVAALEHSVSLNYRAIRYEVIWSCKRSLHNYRYPVPFPIPAQGWSVELENDVPLVSVRVGDRRLKLRLRGGPRYRRQRLAIAQMAAGLAVTGEMALYESGAEVLCKLVAWLPRKEAAGASGLLRVRTAHDSLLVAANDKADVLWRYNADHLKRWIAEHRTQLQRWAEDQKYEQRPVPSFAERRRAATQKYHHRMQSACHEIAAQLVGYAGRRHFAGVVYDDTERGFCPEFPYFDLAAKLQEKLDAEGIEFSQALTEVQPQSA